MSVSTSGPGTGPPAPTGYRTASAWTGGRIVSVVIGAVLALISIGLLTTGAILLWADQSQRTDGFLMVTGRQLTTSGYAVTSDVITLEPAAADWVTTSLGKVRVQVTPADTARPVFLGIAPASAVESYLAGTRYATVTSFPGDHGVRYVQHLGNVSPAAPQSRQIWAAQVSGTGTQTLTWQARGGDWMFVVMNANGSPGVSVSADAGAMVPALTGIAVGLLIAGVVVLAGAVTLIVIPVRLASRSPRPTWQTPGFPTSQPPGYYPPGQPPGQPPSYPPGQPPGPPEPPAG